MIEVYKMLRGFEGANVINIRKEGWQLQEG